MVVTGDDRDRAISVKNVASENVIRAEEELRRLRRQQAAPLTSFAVRSLDQL